MDDDQVLIQQILEGRKSSFEELMRKYNRKIYGFIYRMVRDDEVTIELTQEFFIKIYGLLSKYNFKYRFYTWAYRICYNLVIDHIRKNQMFVDSLDDDSISQKQMVDSKNYVDQDGFEHVSRRETEDFVWTAIETIPLKYRELILLRYFQGMKYDEIAEITDLPIGTVKNRIFKAKEILKREIERNGMFE